MVFMGCETKTKSFASIRCDLLFLLCVMNIHSHQNLTETASRTTTTSQNTTKKHGIFYIHMSPVIIYRMVQKLHAYFIHLPHV